jgi:hypothetical protein
MVSGYIGVELQPQAFDTVLVGAIGRKEVETDSGAPGRQSGPHDLAVVDDVVVEDQVKDSGTTITTQQCAQQVQEQPTPFLIPFDPDQVTRPVVQSTGQVAFFVLPWSENPPLLARQGPIGTDAGIQVDIHFVDVEPLLAPFQGGKQRLDLAQTSLTTGLSPRAQNPGATPAPPSLQNLQAGPEGRSAHSNSGSLHHLPNEQLPTPSGASHPQFSGTSLSSSWRTLRKLSSTFRHPFSSRWS